MGLLITFFPLAADTTPGVGPERFGLLFALWGVLIAVFQLPVSRLVARVRPVTTIGAGFALMALAFVPIAIWPGFWGYLAGIAALAFSETLNSPPVGTLVANMAPLAARARYQSLIGLDWSIGGVIAPLLAGLAYGTLPHLWFWLAAGVVALLPVPLFPLWRRESGRVRAAEAMALGE
jgi:MFS family permease